jgi:ATPase subunit of ABC transporter with duplicated ATPase domains
MWLILKPIFAILRAIPWWAYAIAACLAWGGYQRWRANHAAAEFQQAQAQAAHEREQALAATIAETSRRLAAQAEATKVADAKMVKAKGDAAAAADAAARLRSRLSVLTADAATGHTAIAGSSAPGGTAELLATCADRYRDMAASADRAIIAGHACEQSYNALIK